MQGGWLHAPMYFKAGSYDQASGGSSTDSGRVTSMRSAWSHAASGAGATFEDGFE